MAAINAISATPPVVTVTVDAEAQTASVSTSGEEDAAEFTPNITVTEVPFDPQSAQAAEELLNGVGLNSQSVLEQVRVLAAGNPNPSRADLETLALQVVQLDGLSTEQSSSVVSQLNLDQILADMLTQTNHPEQVTSIFETQSGGQAVSSTVDPQDPMHVYAHEQADGSHIISMG